MIFVSQKSGVCAAPVNRVLSDFRFIAGTPDTDFGPTDVPVMAQRWLEFSEDLLGCLPDGSDATDEELQHARRVLSKLAVLS